MTVVITGAQVELDDGTVAARIERVILGGGERTRMIDGVPETTTDPQSIRFHVRLLSQAGPLIPDQLQEAETYEKACLAGEAYAEKVQANQAKIDDLNESLK
jgi:hypothetical protein